MAEKKKPTQDPRLGQIGGIDTKVCAVTGTEVSAGMQRFSLKNGWYFRAKPSRIRNVDEAFIASMQALVPSDSKESPKKVEA